MYTYLNGGDKIHECYSCLKLMIRAHLNVGFFILFFTKHVPPIMSLFKIFA